METTLREQLFGLADPRYRDFSASLTPGAGKMIGVRLPQLRAIAREIGRGEWRAWLAAADDEYFEERMLRGLVIGYARCMPEEKLRHVARFVPSIDNWAVCDCFCWRLEAAEREPMWEFIQPYFRSEAEYEVRFAVVMALGNFVDEEHLDRLLETFGAVRHEGYYARMGVAWAVSVCFAKFPGQTLRWLEQECPLDDRTYNKALQKIIESYRVSPDDKAVARALKRRKQ
ncbi:MAG: DNA alkylation repair protein [Alistipes sp.]|nr:DNA alkylation repair protein [Alistipes sp.]